MKNFPPTTSWFTSALSTPFILMMIIPILIFDFFLEIYHRVCFPLYRIPYVKRSHYIRVYDRAKLPYLSWPQKVWCAYCGYVNGFLHYASTIAGKTESYFCAIAHLEDKGYIPSEHERSFEKYGDEAALKRRYAIYDMKYGKEE